MIVVVLLTQVILPLTLLIWLAFWPLGSLSGVVMQTAGTAAFLFALARVAQWAVPVWWLPWVYGGVWLVAVLAVLFRSGAGDRPLVPHGPMGWGGMALSVVLLAVGGWYGARAMAGGRLPPVAVVDIANPLGQGHYLVGHGGSNMLVNAHLKTLDPEVARFQAWRGQSYAVDFFGLGPWGLRARGWRPADPAAYAIFGAELRAPCDGVVVAAENGQPDFDVPQTDPVNRLGNHVILRCGPVEIVLAHMRQGSLAVVPGDAVLAGARLGDVGNSGASSEPHLHIHAQSPPQDGAPPISGDPLAFRIDGRFLVRGDRLITPAP
jgi:hypothetical protein